MSLIKSIEKFQIPVIPEETRFWMLRTKAGYFYREYVQNNFVALGWNLITEKTNFKDTEVLRDVLAEFYDEKRPGLAINKCNNFVHVVKKGDIIVIPSDGVVTIALAGEYYEVEQYDVDEEIEIIRKIDNKELPIYEVQCPYRKRRHISILTTVETKKLNYRLVNALSNFHGISCLDEYATNILDAIYSVYSYCDNISIGINVTKDAPINPRDVSKLMYSLTEALCILVPEDSMETSINLNSPGKVVVHLRNAYRYLKSQKLFFLLLIVIATGGKVKDVELPGFVQVIEDIKTLDSDIRLKNLEVEIKQEELELLNVQTHAEQLELIDKYMELTQTAKECNVELSNVLGYIDLLLEVNEKMEFEATEDLDLGNAVEDSTEENSTEDSKEDSDGESDSNGNGM